MTDLRWPEVLGQVGREFPQLSAVITEEEVRRYCQAVGREYDGTVPWLFLTHLGGGQVSEVRRDGQSGRANLYPLELPPGLGGGLVGGMAWDFGQRPQIGERVTISGRYTSITEREGRQSGRMLISILELTYANEEGQWLATQKFTKINR